MKRFIAIAFFMLSFLVSIGQQPLDFNEGKFVVMQGLKITLPRSFIRFSFQVDPVEASILSGKWKTPKKGKIIQLNDTLKAVWEPVQCNKSGWFKGNGFRNGWVYISLKSATDQVVLMEGMGHTMVYVNGIPRIGNKYQSKEQFESWEPKFNMT